MPASIEERPLRTSEVAEILKVSPSTIVAWANQGKLPFHRTLGGQRRFYRTDVETFRPPPPEQAAS